MKSTTAILKLPRTGHRRAGIETSRPNQPQGVARASPVEKRTHCSGSNPIPIPWRSFSRPGQTQQLDLGRGIGKQGGGKSRSSRHERHGGFLRPVSSWSPSQLPRSRGRCPGLRVDRGRLRLADRRPVPSCLRTGFRDRIEGGYPSARRGHLHYLGRACGLPWWRPDLRCSLLARPGGCGEYMERAFTNSDDLFIASMEGCRASDYYLRKMGLILSEKS